MRHVLALSAFVAISCASSPVHAIRVNSAGHEGAAALMRAHAADINARLGCEAIVADGEPHLAQIVWTDWPTLAARFDLASVGGVSVLEDVSGSDPFLHPAPKEVKIWIATTGLPERESVTGELSDCEAAYLFVYWLGQLWGLNTIYEPPGGIATPHPNCAGNPPSPQFDIAGDLTARLRSDGIDVCP